MYERWLIFCDCSEYQINSVMDYTGLNELIKIVICCVYINKKYKTELFEGMTHSLRNDLEMHF